MFFLEETALHTRVAGRTAMKDQLNRLLAVTSAPNVSLGVIPMDAERPMWPLEGFWLFDDAKVLVELATAEICITQPGEVAVYDQMFCELRNLAVFGEQAQRLIEKSSDSMGPD